MRNLLAVILMAAAHTSGIERGYAPVNGLRLYYEVHGKPAKGGVPLVLLHGGGSTIETSFGKLIPIVSKTRQVIAFEQQGHGHTADVDRPFSFEQSAEDAVALLRFLHVAKADFLGYSNGGHISLEIALRHPQVVLAPLKTCIVFPGFGEERLMAAREMRRALDLLAAGDWQAAHLIVQEDGSLLAAWLHGIVHTFEGDLDNARYWYGKAERAFPGPESVQAEIAAARREASGTDG